MEHAAVTAGHIAFERRGALGLVRLTRPDALNALTHGMVLALAAQLDDWAGDDRVACVAVAGEGRAFSAGGDIRAIYDRGLAGEPFDAFFADEYALNIRIRRYPKPYVALVDGIAMGGGVGVAYHASHVVVSERARFAMPECGIGFFPDVGGTALLSPLGATGRWLGLTGARLGHGAQVTIGLARAHLPADRHDDVLEALAQGNVADAVVARFATPTDPEPLAQDGIIAAFGHEGADAIMSGLRDEGDDGPEAAATMRARSPTSLRVASRLLALGKGRSFEHCMGLEARVAHRMLRGHDFYEGIRAAIIDKGRTPQWSPDALGAVTDEEVAAHFAPVGDGPLATISALADETAPPGGTAPADGA